MSFSSPCPEWAKKLAARTQADLSREERAALNAHLLYCQKCVATAASYSRMQQAIRSLPPVKPLADLPHLSSQQTRISSHAFKEPERMSNITDLADRQARQQRKRPNQLRPWVSLVAVAAIALIIGATALMFSNARSTTLGSNSAQTQSGQSTQNANPDCALGIDAGMQYVCTQRLYKDINQEQVKGKYKVVLHQAYADFNRVVVAYQVQVKQANGTYVPFVQSPPPANTNLFGNKYYSALKVQGGEEFMGLFGGNQGGYVVEASQPREDLPKTQELKLQLNTVINELQSNTQLVDSIATDFTVPYHSETKTFQVNQTLTSNGASLTLRSIVASPSRAVMRFSSTGLDTKTSLKLKLSADTYTCEVLNPSAPEGPARDNGAFTAACPLLAQPSWHLQGSGQSANDPTRSSAIKYDWNFTITTR